LVEIDRHRDGSARAPVAIDLFADVGGMAEGVETVGIRTVGPVGFHLPPSWTYALNHPNSAVLAGHIHNLSMNVLTARIRDRAAFEGIVFVLRTGCR
jgi:site-specific DNA-cytosine methylase